MSRLLNVLFLSLVLVCAASVCSIAQGPYLAVVDPDFGSVLRFNSTNGDVIDVLFPIDSSGNRVLVRPLDVTFGPDGNLYVLDNAHPFDPVTLNQGSVVKLDGQTGAFMRVFASGNGLSDPRGLAFGPDGNLYVSSGGSAEVLRFDGETGAFIGAFPTLGRPIAGLAFGPDGNLYVADLGGAVSRFDPKTGIVLGTIASTDASPPAITFGPDGNLYVSNVTSGGEQILRFKPAGGFLGFFVQTGDGGLDCTKGLAFGPDTNLYVSSANCNRSVGLRGNQHGILRFNGPDKTAPGTFMDVFVDLNNVAFASDKPAGIAFPSGCQVKVQRLGQCRIFDPLPYLPTLNSGDFAPWNSTPYAFHNASEEFNGSICDLGCALTSLSMALLEAAPSLPDCPRNPTGFCQGVLLNQPNNPGTLNAFMNRGILLLDYTVDNDVNWDVATRDVGIHVAPSGQVPKLRFDLSCFGLRSDQPARPGCGTATAFLDQHLCARKPVIVRVTGSDGIFTHHKILVVGKSGSDYLINDPANLQGSPVPHHDRLSQYGLFDIVGVVIDPVGDMSGLNISLETNADLLVTDSTGRRTGVSPTTGNDLQEIPQSAHVVDATDDEVTGDPPTSSIHLVNIFQPTQGTYQVTVAGLQLGLYTISIKAYSQDGSPQKDVLIPGIAGPGSSSSFSIQLTSIPGSTSTVTVAATFSSTLADINNSLQLGLIDNHGIANSLTKKIEAAQAATGDVRNNILNAFINEVNAQAGKHITGLAVQILLADAKAISVH